MAQAKRGDTVKVHYTGTLEDGRVFDSSSDREPLEFVIGEGTVIPLFEEAVVGMDIGESKNIKISSEDAYGPRRDEMVVEVQRSEFPENIEPQVGQHLQVNTPEGQSMLVKITDVNDTIVKLDANHPLAGENLTFDIELVQIV